MNNLVLPKIGQGIGEYRWSKDHIPIIREGIELGANLIDTAESYDQGNSEKIVSEAIRGIRDKVIIASKFAPQNHKYEDVIRSLEGSLRRLKTDYIDIYQLHWPNPAVPIEETLSALLSLKEAGKIREIGLSNLRFNEFLKATKCVDIFSLQLEYNLFEREPEDLILPLCEKNNISFFAYSPFDKGRMVNSEKSRELLEKIAIKNNLKISQVILLWMSRFKSVIPIPKSTNIRHLRNNIQAMNFNLPQQDVESISSLCKSEIIYIHPAEISVTNEGEGSRKTYQTLQQAFDNKLNFTPSPLSLAKNISMSDLVKPVRIIKHENKNKAAKYNLIEGRVRYWAWVIKFGNKPIPCQIRHNIIR